MRPVYLLAVFSFVFALDPATAVASEKRITARDLVAIRDIEGLSISPDGTFAAFQVRQANSRANRYETAWYVVSTSRGDARRLADAGDPIQPTYLGRVNGSIIPIPPVWSSDSQWIAYARQDNGRTQVWRTSRDGVRSEQLSHHDADVRAIAFSRDGKRLFFESWPSQAQMAASIAEEGLGGHLYDERFFPSYSTDPIVPRNGTSEAAGVNMSAQSEKTASHVWTYDFAQSKARPATVKELEEYSGLTVKPAPEGRPLFRGNLALSPKGSLAWTEARDPERQGGFAPLTVVATPRSNAAPTVCEAAECTGQLFAGLWWRNDDEVLYVTRAGAVFQDRALYAWKPGNAPRLILRTPHLFASRESDCAIALERLICFYEEPAHPRRLVAINLDSGQIETLYNPNPGFSTLDIGSKPNRLSFRSPTGVHNYGYLVLPPGYVPGDRVPLAIVTYRCYGFLRGGTGDEYPVFPLAAQGIAVLCFNVPDTDWERAARYDHAANQNRERGPGDPEKVRVQEGLETAIGYLDKIGVVDSTRVGITGLSFGAETAMYALMSMPTLAAGIVSGGEIGPASTFLYSKGGRESLRAWGLDSFTSERWDALSITRNADKVRTPLLLNVADRELTSALHPVVALEQADRAVEMYVFPGEYHIKWQPAHRLAIYNRNIDWMNFWLRGVEDSDRAKAEQYKRWRAMRENQCRLFTGPDAPWYCRQ